MGSVTVDPNHFHPGDHQRSSPEVQRKKRAVVWGFWDGELVVATGVAMFFNWFFEAVE